MRPFAGELCAVCGERIHGFTTFAAKFDAGAAANGGAAFRGDDGAAFRGDKDARLCGLCRRARPPFERAVAFGAYQGALRQLLHLFKYERVESACRTLAGFAARAARALPVADALIVPVPLHVKRRRERGFNQAERIARAAARELRLPVEGGGLERARWTESQIGLTRHQRRANLRGAFRVGNRERIAGRKVLLIDDILTTGSTAAECARVLLRAGVRQVYVATVARALKDETERGSFGSIGEGGFVSESEPEDQAFEVGRAAAAPPGSPAP